MGKSTSFSLNIGNKTRLSAFTTLIQHSTGNPSHSNQTKRRYKSHPNWKGKVKLLLFSDGMILYIKKPKGLTKKLLEVSYEFSKVSGYKINILISVAFYMPIMN